MKRALFWLITPCTLFLAGCGSPVLDPSGEVAAQQRDLLYQSTFLMLLIIVPVMALIVYFAWRYRGSNKQAETEYDPDWDHSTQLELVIWGAPLLIIICLGALTWMGTHLLDPYRPLAHQDALSKEAPLQVDVVALDWKWLFIYPQYGVASVNELAAPVGRPISFHITSATVMNSFYIPALAGQIYAMAGMETQLHAVIDKAGSYQGFSANYSGRGFSGMHFVFEGTTKADFGKWIAAIKAKGGNLDRGVYLSLAEPSENMPVKTYGRVDDTLYDAILNECVEPGKMCIDEMLAVDSKGGLGLAGVNALLPPGRTQTALGPTASGVETLCVTGKHKSAWKDSRPLTDMTPVQGAGLPKPSFKSLWQRWSSAKPHSSHT